MISLTKLIFIVAVFYVVWFFFKYRTRIAAAHRDVMEQKARAATAAARKSTSPVAQDLVACPKCGSYIAAGMRCSCEKA